MITFPTHPNLKTSRSCLCWDDDFCTFHDATTGRSHLLDRPVSEIAAIIWCASNGYEFRSQKRNHVSAADIFRHVRRDFADLPD